MSNIEALLGNAESLLLEGRTDDALIALAHASQSDAPWTDAQRGLALALETVAKDTATVSPQAGAQFLQQVLEQVNPGLAFRESLADHLMRLGCESAAVVALDSLIARMPGDPSTWARRASVRFRLGHVVEAWEDVSEAIRRSGGSAGPSLNYLRASLARAVLPPAEALSIARGAASTHPEHLGLLALALELSLECGACDEAEKLLAHPSAPRRANPLLTYLEIAVTARSSRKLAETWPGESAPVWTSLAGAELLSVQGGEVVKLVDAALDEALDLADADERDHAIGLVLSAAKALAESSRPALLARLVARGELSPAVLAHMRSPEDHPAPAAAACYQVVVAGVAPIHAVVAKGQPTGEVDQPFIVGTLVCEHSPESASAAALALEQRIGGRRLEILSCELDPRRLGYVEGHGVIRRSGRIFHRSDEELQAAGTAGAP